MKHVLENLIKEKQSVIKKINNTFRKELLKEDNLTGYPKKLKEVVSLFGADYEVFSQRVDNPFGSEFELSFKLTEEYKYKGYKVFMRCNIFRQVDLGLVKPISTTIISDVRLL